MKIQDKILENIIFRRVFFKADAIVVLSSDGYSDCWDPLFGSLLKYFPEIKNHEIILSTNSKEYNFHGLEVKCICHGNAPWSKRLKNSLLEAKHDIVFIIGAW